MPARGSFKLDTREFRRTLDRYAKISRRDRATIVNTKAFYIARAAVAFTPKADSSKIKKFFEGAKLGRDKRSGRFRVDSGTLAVVGKIINKRRGERGEKGLYGDAMKVAQAMMKAARLRSVAFLKSGWLPAIKTLAKLAERPGRAMRLDKKAEQIGKAKGDVSPAHEGLFITKAVIINLAEAKHDTKEALIKFGGPALQKAIDHEAASMSQYIEEKLKKAAAAAGIKHN